MKKIFGVFILLSSVLILVACGAKDATNYISLEFEGIDTKGKAKYVVDEEKLLKEVFDYEEKDGPNLEVLGDMLIVDDAMDIKLDKDKDLSNGDKVKVTVTIDESKTDKLKSGEKEFEVQGLEEPKKLTDEEIQQNVVFVFEGYSGRGTVNLTYNPKDQNIPKINLEPIEEYTTLNNGDIVQYKVSQASIDSLAEQGYLLDGEGIVKEKVQGLKVVPETPSDIPNLSAIKQLISENIAERFADIKIFSSIYTSYEVEEKQMYYRQFKPLNSTNQDFSWINSADFGALVGVYHIKEYNEDKELVRSYMHAQGYSGIVLDENSKVNITQLNQITSSFDESKSWETVQSFMEGYGYSPIATVNKE